MMSAQAHANAFDTQLPPEKPEANSLKICRKSGSEEGFVQVVTTWPVFLINLFGHAGCETEPLSAGVMQSVWSWIETGSCWQLFLSPIQQRASFLLNYIPSNRIIISVLPFPFSCYKDKNERSFSNIWKEGLFGKIDHLQGKNDSCPVLALK